MTYSRSLCFHYEPDKDLERPVPTHFPVYKVKYEVGKRKPSVIGSHALADSIPSFQDAFVQYVIETWEGCLGYLKGPQPVFEAANREALQAGKVRKIRVSERDAKDLH